MNKATAAVAAGTLVALMAATVWVPCRFYGWEGSRFSPAPSPDAGRWFPVWGATGTNGWRQSFGPVHDTWRADIRLWLIQVLAVAVAGGLAAVALRVRAGPRRMSA